MREGGSLSLFIFLISKYKKETIAQKITNTKKRATECMFRFEIGRFKPNLWALKVSSQTAHFEHSST